MPQTIRSASFSVASFKKRTEGDFVIYEDSKLFEVGDFPDKKFSLSEAEMDAAIARYEPGTAKIDLEHIPTVLDGKLGEVLSIRKEGTDLFGSVKVPKWFDDQLPAETKVSCEWSRENKSLIGLGIVENPRIKSAALMSAFSEANAEDSALFADDSYYKNPMQIFHDLAVKQGAECGGKSLFTEDEVAEFMTPVMLKQIQKMHDMSAGAGGDCDAYKSRQDAGMAHAAYGYSRFSGKNNNGTDNAGAQKESKMKVNVERLMAWFSGVAAKLPEDATEADFSKLDFSALEDINKDDNEVTPAQFAVVEAANADLKTKNDKLTADFSDLSSKFAEALETVKDLSAKVITLTTDAADNVKTAQYSADAAFIDKLVAEFRVTPAAAEKLKVTAKDNPAAFAATKDVFAESPIVTAGGGVNGQVARGAIEGAAIEGHQLTDMAKAYAKTNGVPFSDALIAVTNDNPALASSYRANA
jgi:hypothetical protein